jgi:hypothetical protein
MSSISSVSSTTSANPYQPASQTSYSKIASDFLAIGSALQSGTVTDAQTALANFQQTVSTNLSNSAAQLFSGNSQASSAYQTLVTDLGSGNTTGAQQAYSSLLASLQGSGSGQNASSVQHGHHHHHHHSGEGSSVTSASGSSTSSSSTSGTSASSSQTSTTATDSDGDNDGSSLNAVA